MLLRYGLTVLKRFPVAAYHCFLNDHHSDEFLKLEDITHRYKCPCIMDVKVSTQSFGNGILTFYTIQFLCTMYIYLYMKKAVVVRPDKPVTPGQLCFKLVSSHHQGVLIT